MSDDLKLIVPWLVTLVGGLWSVWQFTAQQQKAASKPFLERQLEICISVVNAVAVMATTTDAVEFEAARKEFWILYYGRLTLVEDDRVEAVMVKIGQMVPRTAVADISLPLDRLGGLSLDLSHDVRKLVLNSWRVTLPNLSR